MAKHPYTAPAGADPWERQTGEGPAAWAAFQVYRDLGQSRTIRKAAERLGKSPAHLSDYSASFSWVDRAAAWDNELDRLARADNIRAIRKMRRRHADLGADMLVKAAEGLDLIPEDRLTAADISRMVEVGSKLERLARGDAGDVIEEREGEAVDPVVFYLPANGRDCPPGNCRKHPC